MRILTNLLFLSCCFSLAACGTSTSPHDDVGLFGTVTALNDGTYQKSLDAKRQKLERLRLDSRITLHRAAQVDLQLQNTIMNKQLAQKEVDITAARKAALQKQVSQLNSDLTSLTRNRKSLDTSLKDLDGQIKKAVKNEKLTDEEIAKLTKVRNLLRKQLELLINRDF